jgi:hypothetical protein
MAVHPPIPGLPERPVLRPGLAVARHDATHLQVGLDAPHRVVVPDLPEVRRLLDAVAAGAPLPDLEPTTWTVLHALSRAGALVEAGGSGRAALAARAQFGASAPARLAARDAALVGVLGSQEVVELAQRLLRQSGAGVAGPDELADAWLVASSGEVSRSVLDDLVREGTPHLLMRGALGSALLGPFVVPGLTACLRCVDAHLAETDPRRALVVEQVAVPPGAEDPPSDPALQSLAVGWAVRDLLRFVEGDRPSTWSATHYLGPTDAPTTKQWTRHPHCGCAWDVIGATLTG